MTRLGMRLLLWLHQSSLRLPGGHSHEDDGQAGDAVKTEDKSINTTDTMNATRLVKNHGENIRYVAERKTHGWMVWDDSRWATDTQSYITELAKDTAVRILDESRAVAAGQYELPHCTAGNLAQWAIQSWKWSAQQHGATGAVRSEGGRVHLGP